MILESRWMDPVRPDDMPSDSCCGPEVQEAEHAEQAMAQADVALAAAGTLCPAEWMQAYQAFMGDPNELIWQAMHEQVLAVLARRTEELAVVEQPAAAAAAAVPAVSATVSEELRAQAIKEAEERVPEALAAIDAAEQACGGNVPVLQQARQRLSSIRLK